MASQGDRWAASVANGFLLGTWNGKQLAVTHRVKPEPRDATDTNDPPPKLTPAWAFSGAIKRAEFSRDGRHLLLVNLNGTAYVVRL